MNAAQINNEINKLRELILSEIHHRILLKNTGEPIIKDEKLFFILLPFLQEGRIDDTMEMSVASVGIVHASLEEHEKIREISSEDKEQQLRVLSGDYYSGRYYEILAATGNIRLIQRLSVGIIKRSEQLIKLYEDEIMTLDSWMQYFEEIESGLIEQFYQSIDASKYTVLAKQVLTVSYLEQLIQQLNDNKQTVLINRLKATNINVPTLQQQVEVIKQQIPLSFEQLSINDELSKWIEENCLS